MTCVWKEKLRFGYEPLAANSKRRWELAHTRRFDLQRRATARDRASKMRDAARSGRSRYSDRACLYLLGEPSPGSFMYQAAVRIWGLLRRSSGLRLSAAGSGH